MVEAKYGQNCSSIFNWINLPLEWAGGRPFMWKYGSKIIWKDQFQIPVQAYGILTFQCVLILLPITQSSTTLGEWEKYPEKKVSKTVMVFLETLFRSYPWSCIYIIIIKHIFSILNLYQVKKKLQLHVVINKDKSIIMQVFTCIIIFTVLRTNSLYYKHTMYMHINALLSFWLWYSIIASTIS